MEGLAPAIPGTPSAARFTVTEGTVKGTGAAADAMAAWQQRAQQRGSGRCGVGDCRHRSDHGRGRYEEWMSYGVGARDFDWQVSTGIGTKRNKCKCNERITKPVEPLLRATIVKDLSRWRASIMIKTTRMPHGA